MAPARPDFPRDFRPLQIYEQISDRIRAEIRSGRFLSDARLPSERELASLFGVGRPAVREAIGALQNECLVVTKRNSGTYVCANAPDILANRIEAEDESEARLHADFSPSATLDVRLILEPAIAHRAACPQEARQARRALPRTDGNAAQCRGCRGACAMEQQRPPLSPATRRDDRRRAAREAGGRNRGDDGSVAVEASQGRRHLRSEPHQTLRGGASADLRGDRLRRWGRGGVLCRAAHPPRDDMTPN
ncbi:unnamed protein product [Candidatus Paraburkholderia kirkii UZHbot1]|uniref:WGS project CAFE00000000 data, contig bkir_c74 n=1 Tax=Candidatus Paraburkholderia kirkii UZHbot1 TaxID=1055526 RepID=U3UB21_9BURK|nr:unnamed protein product [Candidatus Paraburkholderia kirkii UZHbot1]